MVVLRAHVHLERPERARERAVLLCVGVRLDVDLLGDLRRERREEPALGVRVSA